MSNQEVQRLRLQAVKNLLSQSDVEELYGRDQAKLEKLKSLARTEIPEEVDEAVTTFLTEFDIDLEGIDSLVKPTLLVLFQAVRVKGWELKHHVLATKVRSWIIDVPAAELNMKVKSPSVYQSSCHECDEKFDEKRYICPSCGTQIIKP